MHRWISLTTLLIFIIAACNGQDEDVPASPTDGWGPDAPGSPQAFIDRLSMAMDIDGSVFQTTIIAIGSENGEQQKGLWRDELWVYAPEEQARHVFHLGPPGTDDIPAQAIFVIEGNRTFSHFQNGTTDITDSLPARTCPLVETPLLVHHAVTAFCSRFVPQEGEVDELTARIAADAEFNGTRAVALVYEARNEAASDATPEPERLPELTVGRFYLDPANWLPLGWTVEMQDEATDSQLQITATYSNQFIPREQLPDDFFNPAWLDEGKETP